MTVEVGAAPPVAVETGDSRAGDPGERARVARLTPLLPWLLAAVFGGLYAALSLRRHGRFESTGYDLGIFEQAVRAYAHGRPPVSHLRELNLLGDHFSPIMAVFAPFYRLFPAPETLLVGQAVLMGLSLVPVASLCLERFGPLTAAATGTAQGLFWGVQEAVWFDVHEVAFAVPLLAASAVALVRRRPVAAVAWALPLLLVKEDMGATVAVVGLLVAVSGRRRLGAATAAAGLAGLALVVTVLLPAVNPEHRYQYSGTAWVWSHGSLDVAALLAPQKGVLLALVFGPTLLLALRSPVVLLAVPSLMWRIASATSNYWATTFHYSAVLAPVLFAAFADALGRVPAARRRAPLLALAAAAVGVVITYLPAQPRPLAHLTAAAFWVDEPRVAAAREALRLVPDGADVVAGNRLAPHLTARADVWRFPRTREAPVPEYVADDVEDTYPQPPAANRATIRALVEQGWHVLFDRDGIVVVRRP